MMKGKGLDANAPYYIKPIKTIKVNIGTEEKPKI